ncbi:MAG: helix-turn-helix domain-containing protein [Anaerolineaceae bacterium]|nr:helix-turn-helix domain-containing protein [Anaerolineaceae bacterium]
MVIFLLKERLTMENSQAIIDSKNHLILILEKELESARSENDLLKRELFSLRTRLDNYKYQTGQRKFYSPEEIAGILNVSKPTVLNYMKKGLLKHTVLEDPEGMRKTYRISETDFCEFIGSCPSKLIDF